MENTFFLDNHNEIIADRVSGYYQNGDGNFQLSPNLTSAFGASSLYSTSHDLVKWTNFLQAGIAGNNPVISRMLTQGVLTNGEPVSYAFGLDINQFRDTQWISHTGSWASFYTYLVLLPEYRLSIIVLSNYDAQSRFRIAREIASIFVPEPSTGNQVEANEVPNVEVDTSILEDYVGTYKLGPTWYVTITRHCNQLWTQATNEDRYPMIALSDTVFKIPKYANQTMTFYRDHQGTVQHLIYRGEERPKMKALFEHDPSSSSEYIGKYFSEELNTYFSIDSKEGKLELWHFDHGKIELTPVWTDDFHGGRLWLNSVVFSRNDKGRVTGFHTSNFRARNQWFEKLE